MDLRARGAALRFEAARSPVVSIDSGGHRARVLARRDALVEEHLDLVPPIARGVLRGLPPSFDFEDLLAVGYLALIRVATRYRPRQHGGTPFAAFARPRIRGAMLDSIRRRHWVENTRPPIDDEPEPTVEVTIEISIDRTRRNERLAAAIAQLPARRREVLALYYAEHRPSLASVAAALGLSEWRVEREHKEAIADLRRLLGAA